MNMYCTLLGEDIEWHTLSQKEQKLFGRLVALQRRTFCSDSEKPRDRAAEFAEAAYAEVRRIFATSAEIDVLLRGAIGKLLRDGYYRTIWRPLGEEKRREFVDRLRFHPVRPLYDCFLDGWPTRSEFAEYTGIHAAGITRAFQSLLEHPSPKSDADRGVTLKTLREAQSRLHAVPVLGAHPVAAPSDTPLRREQTFITSRERALCVLMATVSRCVVSSGGAEAVVEACQRQLGLHLSRLYGIQYASDLHDMVDAFARDALLPPRLSPLHDSNGSVQITFDPMLTQAGVYSPDPVQLITSGQDLKLLSKWLWPTPPPSEISKVAEEEILDHEFGVQVLRAEWEQADALSKHWASLPVFGKMTRRLGPVISASLRDAEATEESEAPDCYRVFGPAEGRPALLPLRDEEAALEPKSIAETMGGPTVVDRLVDSNRGLEVVLCLEGNVLRVRAHLKSKRPVLAVCRIPAIRMDDGREPKPYRRVFVLGERIAGGYVGECSIPIRKLQELRRLENTNVSLVFKRPKVLLFPNLQEAYSDPSFWVEIEADRDNVLEKVKQRIDYLDTNELNCWKAWFEDSIKPVMVSADSSMTEVKQKLNSAKQRMNWRVYRALTQMLQGKRQELISLIDRRLDAHLAALIGQLCADRAWLFVPEKVKNADWTYYRAGWSKNTPYVNHVLIPNHRSIVRHVAKNGSGYCCPNSKVDPIYHSYSRRECEPAASAEDNSYCALAYELPGPRHRTDPAEVAPGVLILEAPAPQRRNAALVSPGFNAAQLTKLAEAALGIAPHLLVRKHLVRDQQTFCPWHPSFNEFRGENNCWHIIDILEEACHTIGGAINRNGITCAIWYLDWNKEDRLGTAFVLASTGHGQPMTFQLLDLYDGLGQPTVLAKAALHNNPVYDCRDNVERQREVERSFPWLYRIGLQEPVYIKIPCKGDRPQLLLALCKSIRTVDGILPESEELEELAVRLGCMIDEFCDLRMAVLRLWVRRKLWEDHQWCDKNFESVEEIVRDVFQSDGCSIWARCPVKGGWLRVGDVTMDRAQSPHAAKGLETMLRETAAVWHNDRGWRWNDVTADEVRRLKLYWLLEPSKSGSTKKSGRKSKSEREREAHDNAKPVRMMGCVWSSAHHNEPELVFVLHRDCDKRPFTSYNLDLLEVLADECQDILSDWKNYRKRLNHIEQEVAGQEIAELSWQERPLSLANGTSAQLHYYLERFARDAYEPLAVRTVFRCDSSIPTFHTYSSDPSDLDGYYRPADPNHSRLGDVFQSNEPCWEQSGDSKEVRVFARISFSAWVEHHFAQGVLELEWRRNETFDDETKTKLNVLMAEARCKLPAFFSCGNDRSSYADLVRETLTKHCDVEDLRSKLLDYARVQCKNGDFGSPIWSEADLDSSEWTQQIVSANEMSAQHELQAIWSDSDLATSGVYFRVDTSGRSMLIPFSWEDKVSRLVVGCPPIPVFPNSEDPKRMNQYKEEIAAYRQKLRILVGNLAGFWEVFRASALPVRIRETSVLPSATCGG